MMADPIPQPANYRRVNFLTVVAFVFVIFCVAVTVWSNVKDEYAKGIITLVLGRFLGYADAIYNYEFGTTRSSAKKDEAISALTQTASVIATTAQAAQVASDVVASTEAPVIPAGDVTVNASGDTTIVEAKGNT